jgi:hypothetical protein
LHYTIINIGYALLLLNVGLYLKEYSKQEKAFKIFSIYLVFTVLIQVASKVVTNFGQENLFLSHFYFIGQFIALSLFFKSLFLSKKQKNICDWIMGSGLSILAVQYVLDPAVFFKFNLFEIFVTSFLILALASMHLYNLLTERKVFYYCTIGILLYLSGSTILFFVGNLTAVLSKEYRFLPWTLNATLIIVYHLFILFEWKKSFYLKQLTIKNGN